ncbi:hypothetical protein B0T19DRAFT_422416 [Cercophora scortea]|uniref:Uncharacterized protein n=1 Tax=Cercophora scortea TaxID=314031 RepID=A0AAE0MCN6_9PEZI|nr:hypothetical protein B0T19DRAFT_422416 [Cercophora scortea]
MIWICAGGYLPKTLIIIPPIFHGREQAEKEAKKRAKTLIRLLGIGTSGGTAGASSRPVLRVYVRVHPATQRIMEMNDGTCHDEACAFARGWARDKEGGGGIMTCDENWRSPFRFPASCFLSCSFFLLSLCVFLLLFSLSLSWAGLDWALSRMRSLPAALASERSKQLGFSQARPGFLAPPFSLPRSHPFKGVLIMLAITSWIRFSWRGRFPRRQEAGFDSSSLFIARQCKTAHRTKLIN